MSNRASEGIGWRLLGAALCACVLVLVPAARAGEGGQASTSPSNPSPQPPAASPEVQRAVDEAINARLKDSKVVDVETSQAIASRLAEWAKLFAFFVGIPLAICAATLGFLGFRTYSDFSTRVNNARDDALKRLADARTQAETIAKDFEALRARLAEINALASQVQALSQKVDRIEDVVRFKASPGLTPTLKQHLNQTLKEYYAYLKSVGLAVTLRTPTVVIDAKDLNAYYVPAPKNQIVIHPELAPYPDVALREFTHHVLASLNPAWKEDTADPVGLESGLADYLPSSFLDRSDFGTEIWKVFAHHSPGAQIESRELHNRRSFSEIEKGKTEHHSSGTVWGGACWELRESLGRSLVDKLLLAAWKDCDLSATSSDLATFPRELLRQDAMLDAGKNSAKIREVFRGRDLDL